MVGHTSLLIVTKECCCCTSGCVNKRNSHALLWGACTKMGGLTNLCDTPILTRGRVICSRPEKQGPSPSTSQENRAFSSQGLDFENEGEAIWSSGHPSQDGCRTGARRLWRFPSSLSQKQPHPAPLTLGQPDKLPVKSSSLEVKCNN
ncbi:hypothetical protein GOODEAATRI_009402 [Goodea atripinnis]|uniref:Uncharacterized protein n=1 Tax=Goodea atripinnis TaxID=208336 RepID=A0ABV0MGF1_9TELE